MENKIWKYIRIVAECILFLSLGLCLYVFCSSNNEKTKITSTGQIKNITQFEINDFNTVTLPYSVKAKKGETMALECQLPEDIKDNYCLSFRSLYCASEVYVNDKLIGSYGTKLPLPFGRMTGNIRVIIPLTPDMSGQNMILKITPYYSINTDLSNIEIGYTDEIKREILNDNIFRIIVCVVLLTIMFTALGIYCYQIISKSNIQKKLIGSFICFDCLVIAWIVCSSDIPQFFTDCNEGISLVSFLSLSAICIPFMSMCECIIRKKAILFRILGKIGWLLPLIISFCFVLNICDPMEVLPLTHVYIIVCILTSFVFAVSEWRSGVYSKFLMVGMVEIAVAAAVGLIFWFIAPSKGYDATVFGIGFVLFISTLFALIAYMQIKAIEDNKYMDIYKKLAYTDSLTMVKNRTAFELRFAQMQESNYNGVVVSLMMFDLNNLKKTNDTLGHQAGDKLIIGTGRVLQKVFGDIGECFRLGGDEFAVLLTDTDRNLNDLKNTFKEELRSFGRDNELEVSCAVGYAQLKWSPGDTFFRDIYKIADSEMYTDKINTKHGETEKVKNME